MKDKYADFRELSESEVEWEDYQIMAVKRSTPVAIIAIHGGLIEPYTTEIAECLAGDEHSFYSFMGMKGERNRDLHITSTRFDEPQCLAVVRSSSLVVSVHGVVGEDDFIMLGGLAGELIKEVDQGLIAAGFTVKEAPSRLRGDSPYNICNKCISGEGIQLEISRGLRELLATDLNALWNFRSVIMSSLEAVPAA